MMSDDERLDAVCLRPGNLLKVREVKGGDTVFASLYSRPTTIMHATSSGECDPFMRFLTSELLFVVSVKDAWACVLCEGTLCYVRIWERGRRFMVIT